MAVEKMRKGKRKFERKRNRYKLRREEIDVTEELKIMRLLLQILGFVCRYISIYLYVLTHGHIIITNKRC